MIIDGFIFFNELDILESRLKYLNNAVDYFIIVESNVSHSGKSKPLYFLENQNRFSEYKHKIIYYPFIFDNSQLNLDFNSVAVQNDYSTPYWFLENNQRNQISNAALKFFKHDDILMISDVDEIPSLQAVDFVKYNLIPNIDCACLSQKMFYYSLEYKKPFNWSGTTVTKIKLLEEKNAQWFRDNRHNQNLIPEIYNAGWHCSYFGDVNQIIQKIDNFAHQEFNNEYYKSTNRILEAITQSKDLFNRENENLNKNFNYADFDKNFLNSFNKFVPSIHLIVEDIVSAWRGHKNFALWLIEFLKPKVTVDLGVDRGYSSFVLAYNNPNTVYGIDSFEGDIHAGIKNTYDSVVDIKTRYNFENLILIKGYFDDIARTWDKKIDLLHIDGLHTYEAVRNDYETWSKFLTDDAVILFHDTESYPNDVGRFFNEIPLPKVNFLESAGLGVVSKNEIIIDIIANEYNLKKKLN